MKRLLYFVGVIFTFATEGVASDSLALRLRIEGLPMLRLVDMTYFNDNTKARRFPDIEQAPFRPFDKELSTILASNPNKSHLWVRLVLHNFKNEHLKYQLHYGNAERFELHQRSSGQHYSLRGGFLVQLYARPVLPLSFLPLTKDTIYVNFKNYVYPLGELTWVLGASYNISTLENSFIEGNNRWFTFQLIFLSILIFQIIYHAAQFVFLKRKEYLYYALYMMASTFFFGLYFIEVKNQSFSHRFYSTHTIYLFKSLFILYSWAYFKFYKYFLDFPDDNPEIKSIFRQVEKVQIAIIGFDILMMLIRVPAQWEIRFFVLAVIVLIYVMVKANSRLSRIRQVDNLLIKGISLTMNLIAVVTIYEVFSGNPFFDLGIGFLIFQTGAIIETLGYSTALSQKALRIEKDLSRLQLEKERQQEEFQRRLAELEMQALRAQVNPHFIFNCLNSITLMVEKRDNDKAEAYLQKFSKLMRYVLDNARSKTVTLKQDLDALELYIQLEKSRYGNKFNYALEIDKKISLSTLQIPPLLVQPYVENAIWHGLLRRSTEGGMLWVRVKKQDDRLLLEVEDNGIGRKKAIELKSQSAATHRSHGMALTAERLRLLREIAQTDASVEVIDLEKDKNALGTLVRLSLKLSSSDIGYLVGVSH